MNRREALIEIAQQRGVNKAVINAAFMGGAREAINELLSQIALEPEGTFLIPKFTETFVSIALSTDTLLEVADVLIQRPNHSIPNIAEFLAHIHNSRAEELLRQTLELSWLSTSARISCTSAIISSVYNGDYQQALSDTSVLVRITAVKCCEADEKTAALILALHNDATPVRRIAAWVLGRKQVSAAIDTLIMVSTAEEDHEVLRAVIWSLGMLRATGAKSTLEFLSQHQDDIIAQTAHEALARLLV